MDTTLFIALAYGIAGFLVLALIAASLLRARTVNRALAQHPDA